MYGLIHTVAREFALNAFGEKAWETILTHGKLSEADFIAGEKYEDAVTLRILDAIATYADMEMPVLLRAFGKEWIHYTSTSSYKSVYQLYGRDMLGFIENLNRMHDAIQVTLPDAQLPIFEYVAQEEGFVDILYCSKRQGLEAFVEGLFIGLMEYFKISGTVAEKEKLELGTVFRLTFA